MPIHIHDRARPTPLVCWAAYQPRSWFKADTAAPASYTFEALFRMSRPSTWGSLTLGWGWGWGRLACTLSAHQRVQMVPPQGPATEFPSVPPRGQDGCQESQTAHRNLTASAPLSFACPPHQRCNQDTPQLQDTSVPSTPTTLPTALVTAQPNPIPPSGPLHSLLLPPGALSPNFRRDGSHHTGFTLSLCPSAASSETSSLPSKTLTPPSPLSFLSCHLSLSVAMVFWYYVMC